MLYVLWGFMLSAIWCCVKYNAFEVVPSISQSISSNTNDSGTAQNVSLRPMELYMHV